jgi:hypothetical protein
MLGFKEKDIFQGHAGDICEKYGIDWKKMKQIKF